MIAGKYVPKTGRCLSVGVTSISPPDQAGVNSTPLIPGPFLVVALQLVGVVGLNPTGVEVTIVPYRIRRGYADVDQVPIEGVRFMRQVPEGRKGGTFTIGDPLLLSGRTYLWPWYVYEGSAGALAVWLTAEFTGSAFAAITVWELEEFVRAGGRPARDPYADAAARVAEWRRLVERELGVR